MSWLPDWLTGYDAENAARAADADAQLRELNRERYGVDYVNRDDWQPDAAARDSIDAAFVSGLDDGRKNTNSFLWGTLGQFFKTVPTVVWVGLAVAAFAWLGGFTWLARNTKGKLA
jgi:hypothetical protein